MRPERVQEASEAPAEPRVALSRYDAVRQARPASSWRRRLVAWLTDTPLREKRVIVGSMKRARTVSESLVRGRRANRGELWFVDAAHAGGQLQERLRTAAPEEVYFDLGADLDEQQMTRIGADLLMDGATVHFLFSREGPPPVRTATTSVGRHGVISVHAVADGTLARVGRRVLDIVGASVLLVVLAPVFAAVALVVRWRMGRPIFYVQQRVGRGGRHFALYKFRSMVAGADEMLRASPEAFQRYKAANFKMPVADDRLTPIGRLLRRASLDELPQLWNVLRGDMSLVGPRAVVPDEVAQYGDYARMLLRVRPGLTGLWQVSGRSTIGYPERARLDLKYLARRTLRKDLQILLRTLPAVVRQRGAI